MKKYILTAVILVLAIYVIWIGRLFFMSRDFYNHGVKEQSNGKLARAVLWYGSAAKAYFPFNPYVKKSHHSILEVAKEFKDRGDLEEALRSYRELKASIIATRSFYQPHKEKLKRVKSRIKKLLKEREEFESEEGRSKRKN